MKSITENDLRELATLFSEALVETLPFHHSYGRRPKRWWDGPDQHHYRMMDALDGVSELLADIRQENPE